MSYVLESENEFDRLEHQSQQPAYDFKRELEGLTIPQKSKVLDAGSGSGIVARWMASLEPTAQVVGCDFSELRVKQASKFVGLPPNVSFVQGNLLGRLPFEDNTFDRIVCRYVLQHLAKDEGYRKAVKELARVLKPGGELWLVDVDGLLVNMYPMSDFVRECLERLQAAKVVDFYMGRKLAYLATQYLDKICDIRTFTNTTWGASLKIELQLIGERIAHAHQTFVQVLGADNARRFEVELKESFADTHSLYVPITTIVTAKK